MNVLVSVPTRGEIAWQTVTRLEAVRDEHPALPPILYQPGNLSVALTRNTIVDAFLASPYETLVMVDDDVVPPPHFLETLLDAHGYALAAIPHVMPHPADPGKLILTAYEAAGSAYAPCELENGWNTVAAVATGCVALTRAAIERLGPAPFRIAHDPAAPITSDDFLLCSDLADAGLTVGCFWDGWHCDHVTTVGLAPMLEAQRSVC